MGALGLGTCLFRRLLTHSVFCNSLPRPCCSRAGCSAAGSAGLCGEHESSQAPAPAPGPALRSLAHATARSRPCSPRQAAAGWLWGNTRTPHRASTQTDGV